MPFTLGSSLANVYGTSTPLAECTQFVDGSFLWGAVKRADVYMGGASDNSELASDVPILVMGDSGIPSVPSACSQGGINESTQSALGANGILGVGNYQYDCDVLSGTNPCTTNSPPSPALYYTCTGSSGSCTASTFVLTQNQVANPVSLFTTDNNGVILELPSVATGSGAATATGALVFGIGTASNNALGNAAILTLVTNSGSNYYGNFTTSFAGHSYPGFIDSGSNAYYVPNVLSVTTCDGGWYCPSSTLSESATNTGANSAVHKANFSITSEATLAATGHTAFNDLAAPYSSVTTGTQYFDWGLSFFFGRNVYTSIHGINTSGAYWAWLP